MTLPAFGVLKVVLALNDLGGEASLRDIYQRVRELTPDWKEGYKNEDSFEATIRHTLEAHCPQSENWRVGNEAYFERTDKGRYRAVPIDERAVFVSRTQPRLGAR